MKKQAILVVDYGTSNVRVNAIDAQNGKILYSESKKYLILEKQKGNAELSAEELWSFSVECMGTVTEQMTEKVVPCAVTFSFFGDNLIPTDEKGNVLNDCILCTDSRGVKEAEYINDKIPKEEQIEIIGDSYTLYKFGTKVLWMKKQRPEISSQAVHWDSQQQYIFRQLGLPAVNDYTMAARKQTFDIHNLQWSKRFLDVLEVSEASMGKEIVGTGDIIGFIKAYGKIQFKKPLPVIAGGHDCDVAMIGMGIVNESQECIGDITGTFDHVGYLADGFINLKKQYPELPFCSYSGPLKKATVCLGAFPTAGAALEWFMREINGAMKSEDYQKLWDKAVFDGSGSIMMFPTLDNHHGRIKGIGVTTTKTDIFKGVIEALTFENRKLIEICKKVKNGEITSVRIGGGAANSEEWMQLRADISGMCIERMENIQISSLGSAVLAAVAVGIYPDLKTAVKNMVRVQDTFFPNPEIKNRYEEKYQEYQNWQ